MRVLERTDEKGRCLSLLGLTCVSKPSLAFRPQAVTVRNTEAVKQAHRATQQEEATAHPHTLLFILAFCLLSTSSESLSLYLTFSSLDGQLFSEQSHRPCTYSPTVTYSRRAHWGTKTSQLWFGVWNGHNSLRSAPSTTRGIARFVQLPQLWCRKAWIIFVGI